MTILYLKQDAKFGLFALDTIPTIICTLSLVLTLQNMDSYVHTADQFIMRWLNVYISSSLFHHDYTLGII